MGWVVMYIAKGMRIDEGEEEERKGPRVGRGIKW